jgi:hypothetical protein
VAFGGTLRADAIQKAAAAPETWCPKGASRRLTDMPPTKERWNPCDIRGGRAWTRHRLAGVRRGHPLPPDKDMQAAIADGAGPAIPKRRPAFCGKHRALLARKGEACRKWPSCAAPGDRVHRRMATQRRFLHSHDGRREIEVQLLVACFARVAVQGLSLCALVPGPGLAALFQSAGRTRGCKGCSADEETCRGGECLVYLSLYLASIPSQREPAGGWTARCTHARPGRLFCRR